ncbi:MAG: Hydrogenase 2 maturation protease [Candidatus Accumulibacter adjunctus]|uniref:Hydrogenase 2 maturation protease n=1 Tax=Candidatus Accumulibacter adjunctus TaxID=1454001 RepID=A0A011NSH3_9PROT|nr:MAG: Hydrogenase 2 maturation protease [Candidatus Accumulibacter adjunctus]
MRVVVLGVGNVLLSDEGLGVRAVERLQRTHRLPPEVEVIDGGTSGMELLEQIEGIDALIMVDAIRAGAPPATPIRLAGEALPVFFRTRLSPHQVGLSDVLASLEFLGRSPRHICILGLQPQSLALGMELSREVEEGMPALLGMVTAELASLGLAAPAKSCGGS